MALKARSALCFPSISAMATMMVATAIDGAEWKEVYGTIAGDDTVLVILDAATSTPIVMQRFNDMRPADTLEGTL